MHAIDAYLLSSLDDEVYVVVCGSNDRRLFCSEPFPDLPAARKGLGMLRTLVGESVCRRHEQEAGRYYCAFEPSPSMRLGHCGPFAGPDELQRALDELTAGIAAAPVHDLTVPATEECPV